jgi:hypothetical protein
MERRKPGLLLLLLLLLLLVILLLQLLFVLPGPPSAATELAGKNPEGATCMDARRFLPRQDVASDCPAGGVNP